MAEDHVPTQAISVTSDEFRELAKSTGKALNDATRKDLESASNDPGFVLININEHKRTVQEVMKHFELKEFERLHPGRNIRWHKSIHRITKSVSIDESTFGDAEEDLLLLPLFVGKPEHQDKIGQPSSSKTSFRMFEGDILLIYKTVAGL